MQKLKEQLKGLDEELHKTPVTLEELKQVLNVINTIKSTSMNMELRYVDLEERFRQAGLHLYAQADLPVLPQSSVCSLHAMLRLHLLIHVAMMFHSTVR